MLHRITKAAAVLVTGLMLTAGSAFAADETDDPTAKDRARVTAPSPVKEIVIEPDGNKMAFATTEITVKAGQEVRLVFDNTATSPAMKHNVVIVEAADDIQRVGQAAMSEQDYVPDDDAIVAYTPLADPGEKVEVTFTAPDTPGDRPFICTFPGHYMSMQGIMRVQK